MPEPLRVWFGIEDSGGIPRPERVYVPPPPHWRLEAIAATERPRSLTVAPDGRTAVFIQDRDTSDLWTIDLEGGALERLTTGRAPQPYWEDTQPAVSPDGSTVAYGDEEPPKYLNLTARIPTPPPRDQVRARWQHP